MMQDASPSSKSVWVIDDDETALLLAEAMLATAGFQVRTFSEAPSALAAAPVNFPDIIVVDLVMPGMDGFEFCARLRNLTVGADIPVLVTTSLDDPASIDRAYQAGATNFATKPINWAIEIQRLRYMLKSADTANELRQKERETRLAKEDWERTFDAISDIVTVLDTDRKVLRANAATVKLLGKPIETIVGRVCHELFCDPTRPCAACPAAGVQATNLPLSVEVPCGPAGTLCEVTVSPVTDAQGRVTHLVHVARDLSEKKQLEAEVRQAQKMEAIGTLAGGIAHDFNNLLTVIQCCAEMLLAEKASGGDERENLEAVLEAARRGITLTKQLLVFSRKGTAVSQKHVMNLNDSLKSVGKMLEKGFLKTVSQQYRLAEDLHAINADAGQLQQVVMNLAVNAAHAMPAGGTLTLETQNTTLGPDYCQSHPDVKPGNYVLLTVSDTGHGMDKVTLDRIYEPFFTTKKVGEGTGLGLSVVFGIVHEHGGYITCYSEMGVGTTFRIYLPAVDRPDGQLLPTVNLKPAVPVGTETILVVDDEAPIRNLLERHLATLGYAVISAVDGSIALRRYSENNPRPHAVILDLGMPNVSGWECLEKLHQLNPQIKVIVATGYGGDDVETRVFEQGAAGFLRKPYHLADMSRKLREILDAPLTAPVK